MQINLEVIGYTVQTHNKNNKAREMLGFVFGFLLGMYFWRCWTWPRVRSVKPGLNKNVILPHVEELEIHHNTMSSNSQKVRVCLGETGLKHRQIHHVLPTSGSWSTKCADFLSKVNPAGTVPVLVHNGHPIYESHEQILYIDQVLMPGGPRLTPKDPKLKALMDKWVESGAMIMPELQGDPWAGLSKRVGNLLPIMTLPIFAAKYATEFTIWNLLESASMIPLVSDRKIIMMHFVFKILGVEAFDKVGKMKELLSFGRKAFELHFSMLTKDLEESGGPYICGTQFTLADCSLVPVLERMTYAKWWTKSLKSKYPVVYKYWEAIQKRDGYKASKPDKEMHDKLIQLGHVIDEWKTEHKWFNAFYEN